MQINLILGFHSMNYLIVDAFILVKNFFSMKRLNFSSIVEKLSEKIFVWKIFFVQLDDSLKLDFLIKLYIFFFNLKKKSFLKK